MTAYEGQIKALDYKTREYAFLSVRATGNVDPYRFATKEAAHAGFLLPWFSVGRYESYRS